MKTIISGIFIVVILNFLFLSIPLRVFAQPTPTPTGILIPGKDCGALNQKCCFYQPVSIDNPPFPKPNMPVADQLIDILNTLYNQVFKPRIAPLNNIVQSVIQPCLAGSPSTPGEPGNPNCICIQPTTAPLAALTKLCNGVSTKEQGECNGCINSGGVWTGVGCVYASVQGFIEKTLLSWGIGLAGIIALLCIIYAAFTMQTSGGNPEKIKKAQELLTSCIMGLMLIIFSIFILRLIGVDILRIPGFR